MGERLLRTAVHAVRRVRLRDIRCRSTLILFAVEGADPEPSGRHGRTLLLLRRR